MFISRIVLDPSRLGPARLGPIASGGAYGEHKAVWRLFGDRQDRQRDFLYRRETGRWPSYIVVSARRPDDPDRIWQIETKPYSPNLSEGDMLSFVLRANPVRRRRTEDGRSQRHDVVMEAKHQLRTSRTEPASMPSQAELAQQTGTDWLVERAVSRGYAVTPEQVLVEGYTQHQLRKGSGERIQFSTLDFRGLLKVTDTELFLEILFNGIGPAKSFGCGLMLVRPITA